jgi:hypothetical protein
MPRWKHPPIPFGTYWLHTAHTGHRSFTRVTVLEPPYSDGNVWVRDEYGGERRVPREQLHREPRRPRPKRNHAARLPAALLASLYPSGVRR